MTFSWAAAGDALRRIVAEDKRKTPQSQLLDDGQRASLMWMAQRIQHSGIVLADEVGTGKTRIACAAVHAVLEAGGRAAVVVPHGLMHQWIDESLKLSASAPVPKSLTTLTEFLTDVSSKEASHKDVSPHPDEAEWWLVSHGFRAPLVRNNSEAWRAALPALVEMHLAPRSELEDRRTRYGKLHRKIAKLEYKQSTLQHKTENAESSSYKWIGASRIASEVAPRVQSRLNLRRRIENLPPLNVKTGNNDQLLAAFGHGGDGRQVTEEILGLWLGEFDLIVIDEAHKSRGEMDIEGTVGAAEGTVLTRLVDAVLKQPLDGRRLCLTATPMEMELSQWLNLLARARCGLDPERGRQVVERFYKAAKLAVVFSDVKHRLDELCAAAQDFSKTLAPYVTRRRRDEDPLVVSFRADAKRPDGLPHPYRRLERVQIGWTQISSGNTPWLDVLFAAECMCQSAKGLLIKDTKDWPRAVRDAYTKLAAGYVSIDLLETNEPLRVPEPGVVDDDTRGKIARVAYWYRQLREARSRVVEDFVQEAGIEVTPDAEHPRILAAVREIESWTAQQEKVLVFGVFLQPLRLLRDVLNVRHALRSADAEKPIAHSVHTDPALLGIAVRQANRLRDEGFLTGRLAIANSTEVRRALRESHKAYTRLRRQVRKEAQKPVRAWRANPALLEGAPADRELDGVLRDHLVAFILDDFLASESELDQLTRDRIDQLSEAFLKGHLYPLLDELGDENAKHKKPVTLRQDALRRALLNDYDGRQSLHARLLQGDTEWDTRRYIQAAFNRPGASPRVLIAQSQVGREGLNLHESCRVVLQFHAEWNPAVLEQQIGRVDRKGSRWEQLAQHWLQSGNEGLPPFIEVRQLIFEGTYDAYQWDRVMSRKRIFDASLFGALLPAEAWIRVPEDRLKGLIAAAPSFAPLTRSV